MHAVRLLLIAAALCLGPADLRAQSDALREAHARGAELYEAGRYEEATPFFRQAVELAEREFGPDDPRRAIHLINLGHALLAQGRLAEAEPPFVRALTILEPALEPGHPGLPMALSLLDSLLRLRWERGRLADAASAGERALRVREAALPPDAPEMAANLSDLAALYHDQGRYAEAEELGRHALAIRERTLGPDSLAVAQSLNILAGVYLAQGRYAEAEPLFTRALAIRQVSPPEDDPAIATSLNNLAELHQRQGRYEAAKPLFERALAILERARGPNHPEVAAALNNLAGLYQDTGRADEAVPLHERALRIGEETLGPDHHLVALSLNNLAALYHDQGRLTEAESLYQRALAIHKRVLGPEHPQVAADENNLASLYRDEGRSAEALRHIRRATAIHHARARRLSGARTVGGESELTSARGFFINHAAIAGDSAAVRPERRSALWSEAFEAGQLAHATGTAAAVSRMAARFAAGDGVLAWAAREQQGLLARWRELDAALVAAASRPPGEREADVAERLRGEIAAAERQLDALDARLAREFPTYAELLAPRPLTFGDVKVLLRPGEALVAFLIADEGGAAWVVRADGAAEIRVLNIGRIELMEQVETLRLGLDPRAGRGLPRLEAVEDELRGAERLLDGRSVVGGFDVDRAHALHEQIWAPVAPLLEGVKHVLVVPDGPLESLPFHVLVTETPNRELARPQELRAVAWLAREHALSVLPAVSSLWALRELAPGAAAGRGFVGVGDPVLGGRRAPEVAVASLDQRGLVADVAALRELAPLPESADELRALAASLGAGEEALHLGPGATERRVRALDRSGELARAGVLAFATHGLVAGELKDVTEPGLVLTPPEAPSAEDDGLLAASEVAELDLNADWVLLSACNTAAADGTPRAEGLSGLARAFFYAGARALLVSHWSVYSPAAVALTTGTLERLRQEPGPGRAEALRRTLVELIEHGPDPHPAYWAPFVVVGEGGAPTRTPAG